jgi:hypothetical protein
MLKNLRAGMKLMSVALNWPDMETVKQKAYKMYEERER